MRQRPAGAPRAGAVHYTLDCGRRGGADLCRQPPRRRRALRDRAADADALSGGGGASLNPLKVPLRARQPVNGDFHEATKMLATAVDNRTVDRTPLDRNIGMIPQPAETAARLHLLVVDSDAAVRSACAEIAASLGYAAESSGDLEQVRGLLADRTADILLVNLPAAGNQ